MAGGTPRCKYRAGAGGELQSVYMDWKIPCTTDWQMIVIHLSVALAHRIYTQLNWAVGATFCNWLRPDGPNVIGRLFLPLDRSRNFKIAGSADAALDRDNIGERCPDRMPRICELGYA
jgi:hypothetical protein